MHTNFTAEVVKQILSLRKEEQQPQKCSSPSALLDPMMLQLCTAGFGEVLTVGDVGFGAGSSPGPPVVSRLCWNVNPQHSLRSRALWLLLCTTPKAPHADPDATHSLLHEGQGRCLVSSKRQSRLHRVREPSSRSALISLLREKLLSGHRSMEFCSDL